MYPDDIEDYDKEWEVRKGFLGLYRPSFHLKKDRRIIDPIYLNVLFRILDYSTEITFLMPRLVGVGLHS